MASSSPLPYTVAGQSLVSPNCRSYHISYFVYQSIHTDNLSPKTTTPRIWNPTDDHSRQMITDAQRNKSSNDDHNCSTNVRKEKNGQSRNGLCIATREKKKEKRENEENGVQRSGWIWSCRSTVNMGKQTPDRSRSPDPAGAVIYLPALPPLASLRTVFHSMSDLSSAWMEAERLRAFFKTSRVLA